MSIDSKKAKQELCHYIKAYRRAPNDRIAEKEWQRIFAAVTRIEAALNAYYGKAKDK
jgi:predicted SprT family Zn-dependent metalloprotease